MPETSGTAAPRHREGQRIAHPNSPHINQREEASRGAARSHGSEIWTPARAARGSPVVRIGVRPTSYVLLKAFSNAIKALTLSPTLRLPNTSRTVARRSVNAFR